MCNQDNNGNCYCLNLIWIIKTVVKTCGNCQKYLTDKGSGRAVLFFVFFFSKRRVKQFFSTYYYEKLLELLAGQTLIQGTCYQQYWKLIIELMLYSKYIFSRDEPAKMHATYTISKLWDYSIYRLDNISNFFIISSLTHLTLHFHFSFL